MLLSHHDHLAIEGGRPVRARPFAPWPHFEEDEVAAAVTTLRSGRVNYWTGEEGRRFEQDFARFVGCAHGIALTNGTVALELALLALGIGPGDEVIVTCRTFIASASCIVRVGATPVMADVDAASQNVTAETLRAALTPRTKAVIAVHLAGWPCDMDPILAFARTNGLKVIEDCAQAHGATYHGAPVGSLGDVAAFSFCQDKILTTGGEGGLVATNDPELYERMWRFKDHGKNRRAMAANAPSRGFRWVHDDFGTNWRLSEVQAAIGRIALEKLPGWLERRRRHAAILTAGLAKLPALRVTRPGPGFGHAYYKYYAFVRPERLQPGWDRNRVMAAIAAEGVPCLVGSCSEIYLERAFPPAWRPPERLPVARALGETALMFLVHPTLDEAAMHDAVAAATKVLRTATWHAAAA